MSPRKVLVAAATGLGSVFAAFFLVFNGLFSDGPRDPFDPERLVLYALVFLAYLVLAAVGERFGGGRWMSWATGLAVAPLLVCVLYPVREPGIAVLAAVEALVAVTGAFTGARLARRKPKLA